MTHDEAIDLAIDRENMLDEARVKDQVDGPGSGDALRREAHELERQLVDAGFDPLELASSE